jgi:hypothetical protein
VAESKVGSLFINGQAACLIWTTLEELGHPQPPTIIITDNECALGIANNTVKQRRSKAIDMRFYWIKDRVAQGQLSIYWKKGADNLADYFTKEVITVAIKEDVDMDVVEDLDVVEEGPTHVPSIEVKGLWTSGIPATRLMLTSLQSNDI